MPTVLRTDQGCNFESHLFTAVYQLFSISKKPMTPYHPQTDGLCERFNGVSKLLLRIPVNKDLNDWDKQLPSALLAYLISKQDRTSISPFEFMYGRAPKVSFATEADKGSDKTTIKGPAHYLSDLKNKQNDLRNYVTKKTVASQSK